MWQKIILPRLGKLKLASIIEQVSIALGGLDLGMSQHLTD